RRGFRTKNEAIEWERTNVPDRFSRYHHVPTLPPTMPFAAFVEQVWRPAFAARSNAPATRRAYEQVLARHILPALGTRPVRDLERVALMTSSLPSAGMASRRRRFVGCSPCCRASSLRRWTVAS